MSSLLPFSGLIWITIGLLLYRNKLPDRELPLGVVFWPIFLYWDIKYKDEPYE